ncbi:MAG: glycerol-3-phosphate acyltransferase [Dehalococcoidales bacterium]|nr:glycerol-3-phosphate acyltransferase [Dehalococcoidales bacterium]
MDIINIVLLGIGAFLLGACPFSLWVGRFFLRKDIRNYGDANPGAWNVLRAGGRKAFALALILDVAKGIPFILIADLLFKLTLSALLTIGFCAILGHVFSPFLRFRGGKAVAVTFGVLVALPQRDMFFALVVFIIISVLFIEVHAWVVMIGTIGSLTFLIITGISIAEIVFMTGILFIFAFRYFSELKTKPGYKGVLVNLFQAVRR